MSRKQQVTSWLYGLPDDKREEIEFRWDDTAVSWVGVDREDILEIASLVSSTGLDDELGIDSVADGDGVVEGWLIGVYLSRPGLVVAKYARWKEIGDREATGLDLFVSIVCDLLWHADDARRRLALLTTDKEES